MYHWRNKMYIHNWERESEFKVPLRIPELKRKSDINVCDVYFILYISSRHFLTPPPFQRSYAQAANSVTVCRISELTVKFVLCRSDKRRILHVENCVWVYGLDSSGWDMFSGRFLWLASFNLLAPGIIFLILAHPVYKIWIIQEPNTLELWNKLHFEEKKESLYHV